MRMTRRYTTAGQDPYSSIKFVPRTSRISNPDGSLVFEMKDILIPEGWSQVAVDVIAQKYFRKAGVAQTYEKVPEAGIPVWLQRAQPVGGKIDGVGSRILQGAASRQNLAAVKPLGRIEFNGNDFSFTPAGEETDSAVR